MDEAKQFEVVLTPERVGRWLAARDDRLVPPPAVGAPVPMPCLVFLRMQPALGLSIHAWLGRDPERGLYGGVTYEAMRVPRVGDTLRARSTVVARKSVVSPAGDLVVTTLLTEYRLGDALVLTESVRMIDLPPGGAARPAAASTETEAASLPVIAVLPPLTRRQIAWMTVETGDHNALHVDRDVAVRRGFEDVVAPAPLLTALIERELVARFGGHAQRLDLRFQAPTLPGQALELRGQREGDDIVFKLFGGGLPRASGRVTLDEGSTHDPR